MTEHHGKAWSVNPRAVQNGSGQRSCGFSSDACLNAIKEVRAAQQLTRSRLMRAVARALGRSLRGSPVALYRSNSFGSNLAEFVPTLATLPTRSWRDLGQGLSLFTGIQTMIAGARFSVSFRTIMDISNRPLRGVYFWTRRLLATVDLGSEFDTSCYLRLP